MRGVRRSLAVAALLVLAAPVVRAEAPVEQRYQAVRSLGELNGVALVCRYVDEVRRMKRALVDTLPRERAYGLAFEESTDESFQAFVEKRQPCPGAAAFGAQVDQALATLKTLFAAGGD